jgi:NADP-dependent 3-hydroxy acid dehydrogenase YdfG
VKITYRAVDVGNYEEVDAAVSSSIKEMGDIDILINNVPTHHSQQKSTIDTHN